MREEQTYLVTITMDVTVIAKSDRQATKAVGRAMAKATRATDKERGVLVRHTRNSNAVRTS